jgi:DNA-binding NarL/FixJ family response regulator
MLSEPDRDAPLKGLRILVADDEFMIAIDLESILAEAGAEVVGPFQTAADALGAAEQPLSAAVLDIRLGEETSDRVAERLAGLGVPFLYYSGQALGDAGTRPAAPVLTKPCQRRVLIEAVRRPVEP